MPGKTHQSREKDGPDWLLVSLLALAKKLTGVGPSILRFLGNQVVRKGVWQHYQRSGRSLGLRSEGWCSVEVGQRSRIAESKA